MPCPTCLGTGVVDPEKCQAKLSNGQPCGQFARAFTEPRYMELYAVGDRADYSPSFMSLCQRHGNAERRKMLDRRRIERGIQARQNALDKKVVEQA